MKLEMRQLPKMVNPILIVQIKNINTPTENRMNTLGEKQKRVEHANQLISIIASHGRKFFQGNDRMAKIELVRGRVWFIDDYRGARIYTNKTTFGNDWGGFSHGGTMRSLVEKMRDYITAGVSIPLGHIAPTRIMDGGHDMWGYGPEACIAVRAAAKELPIIAPSLPKASPADVVAEVSTSGAEEGEESSQASADVPS